MEVIRGLHNLREEHRGCVVTIGNFDGVHRGHQAILDQCREQASKLGLPVAVVVFEPQPREFFAGDQAPPRLTRLREKVRLLGESGVDYVLCLPFNEHLRSLTAVEFVERVLVRGLGVRHLVVGDDFRFGCDRSGDFNLLSEEGERLGQAGFSVEHTRTFALDDERVSSTRVRTLLASGNFVQTARMLGRPFHLGGRVIADQKLGRTIGAPTANIPLPRLPLALRGVFAVVVELPGGERFNGVANIGWRPTVGSDRPLLEAHLFDFDGDLYGRRLTVFPCARLRGEQKFDDFAALKQQIMADQAQARGYFIGNNFADNRLADEYPLPLASAPLAREAAKFDASADGSADHDDG